MSVPGLPGIHVVAPLTGRAGTVASVAKLLVLSYFEPRHLPRLLAAVRGSTIPAAIRVYLGSYGVGAGIGARIEARRALSRRAPRRGSRGHEDGRLAARRDPCRNRRPAGPGTPRAGPRHAAGPGLRPCSPRRPAAAGTRLVGAHRLRTRRPSDHVRAERLLADPESRCARPGRRGVPRVRGRPSVAAGAESAGQRALQRGGPVRSALARKFVAGLTPGYRLVPGLGGNTRGLPRAEVNRWRERYLSARAATGVAGFAEFNFRYENSSAEIMRDVVRTVARALA